MRVKLDENFPAALAGDLAALGHDVQTVIEEGLKGRPDGQIADAAGREGRFLVSQDLDFSDARRFVPGRHPGLLLVRLKRPGREALRARVCALFRREPVETWAGCLVVATETKVRIRRPQT